MRFNNRAAALMAVVAVMVLQALYAVRLNAEFYRVHAPFFDSCSYTNQLADVACLVHKEGVPSGIRLGLAQNVALPWLEMAVLAKFVEPSRALGIWMQAVWLALLALSIYWYLVRYRAAPAWLGFCLTLPFISFAQIYFFDGGLPDFRMDLSLYIFTSLASVWYLATYETESRVPWLLSGVAIMLGCLARATAPVYLSLMLGPLIALRFWNSRGRRKDLLERCLWMAFPILLAAAGFLLRNFHNLYFYYVTWSPDANRNLPLRQSYPHLVMTLWHVGEGMVACSLLVFAINFWMGRIKNLDWKILWLAFSGPLFLFFRGVALNSFVSMPAIFGCLLFAYFPFRGVQPFFSRRWVCVLAGVLAAGASIHNAMTPDTTRPYKGLSDSRMEGFKTVVGAMSADASARGLDYAVFAAPMSGEFNCSALENVMIYEFGALCDRSARVHEGGCGEPRTLRSGVTLQFRHNLAFTPTDQLLWKLNVPGETDAQKIGNLVSIATESADYLLLPDEATLGYLEEHSRYEYINLRVRELKQRLLGTGDWSRLGAGSVSPHETIEVYARKPK